MIIQGDANHIPLADESIDCIVTDPPYGYSFMNKDWDKVVVSVETWKECLRVMKAGAFAFIMSAPRQDVLSRMIVNLQDAGFETGFSSIYWTYASGFPKAANVSKLVDKRNGRNYNPEFREYLNNKRLEKRFTISDINRCLGYSTKGGNICHDMLISKDSNRFLLPTKTAYKKLKILLDLDDRFDDLIEREEAEREIIGKSDTGFSEVMGDKKKGKGNGLGNEVLKYDITKSATSEAKSLDGSYAGFQPKPAVEIVLTVMKPLEEKSYVDQALSNRKGVTWLDDCRIPYQNEDDLEYTHRFMTPKGNDGLKHYRQYGERQGYDHLKKIPTAAPAPNQKGRFPANLLVSDDMLNDGKIRKSSPRMPHSKPFNPKKGWNNHNMKSGLGVFYTDSGSFSRYFSLDKWFSSTFPFLITPKASKSERNMGLITSYIEEKARPSGMLYGNPGENRRPYLHPQKVNDGRQTPVDNPFQRGETLRVNTHPTVKPIKLMSYLIMLGSREGDTILDPFVGSGTTSIAAKMLNRKHVGIEINQEYCDIANARLIVSFNSPLTLFANG